MAYWADDRRIGFVVGVNSLSGRISGISGAFLELFGDFKVRVRIFLGSTSADKGRWPYCRRMERFKWR